MAELRPLNRDKIGRVERRASISTSTSHDDLIGSLVAETFLGWLSVDGLGVAGGNCGCGHAAALLDMAEREARRRGGTDCVLETFSFQAPGFDRKRGYREFGRLDGFPAGHHRYYMTKSL